jgi:hypothetical protein
MGGATSQRLLDACEQLPCEAENPDDVTVRRIASDLGANALEDMVPKAEQPDLFSGMLPFGGSSSVKSTARPTASLIPSAPRSSITTPTSSVRRVSIPKSRHAPGRM